MQAVSAEPDLAFVTDRTATASALAGPARKWPDRVCGRSRLAFRDGDRFPALGG